MANEKRDRQRQNREEKQKRLQKARRNALVKKRLRQSVWIAVIVMAFVTISNLIGGSKTSTTTTTDTTTDTSQSSSTSTTITEPTTFAPSALGPAYEAFRSQKVACGATAPSPAREMQFDAPEDQQIDPAATVTATISTSCGDILIRLDPGTAPETVNSFVFLARQGFFDGTVFHRIAPGFVIQGGDPTAVGTGGPGYTIADEFPAPGFAYDRGVVAMANAGTNSTGSQFFIALADTGLQADYSPLGTVLESDATLDAIAAVPVTASASGEISNPQETVYINTVTVDITN